MDKWKQREMEKQAKLDAEKKRLLAIPEHEGWALPMADRYAWLCCWREERANNEFEDKRRNVRPLSEASVVRPNVVQWQKKSQG